MRSLTQGFCPIDHVAIDVSDIKAAAHFFEDVLGMSIYRVQGLEEAPSSYWLDGGVQLIQAGHASTENGRFHHLAFQTVSVEQVLDRAAAYDVKPVPGKGGHWFMYQGIRFEMKQVHAESL